MKKIILFSVLLITTALLQAQEHPELNLKEGFWGLKHYVGGKKTEKSHFVRILKTDATSYDLYKKGKRIQTGATIVGSVGVVAMVISTIALGESGGNVEVPLIIMGTGLGLIGTAAIIEKKGNNQKKLAVEEFNVRRSFSLKIGASSNGVGLVVSF